MATTQDIAELRRLIAEPTQDPYTDEELSRRLDGVDDPRKLASDIWTEKAARYAELVDIQEGSSRRSLGDLHEQAIAMARQYSLDLDAVPGFRRARTRPIVRP